MAGAVGGTGPGVGAGRRGEAEEEARGQAARGEGGRGPDDGEAEGGWTGDRWLRGDETEREGSEEEEGEEEGEEEREGEGDYGAGAGSEGDGSGGGCGGAAVFEMDTSSAFATNLRALMLAVTRAASRRRRAGRGLAVAGGWSFLRHRTCPQGAPPARRARWPHAGRTLAARRSMPRLAAHCRSRQRRPRRLPASSPHARFSASLLA